MSAITLGIGIATNNNSTKETAPVEATGTTKTLYINHFDGRGYWNNFSYYLFGGIHENAPFPGEVFTDSMKTSTPNEYDQYQYKLDIDTSLYQYLILVGNPSEWGGTQAKTEDLSISDISKNGIYCGNFKSGVIFDVGYYLYTTKTVYLHDLDGSTYSANHYVHTFATGKKGTTWPGVEMTKVSGTNNIYSAEINSALDNVMFNNDDDGNQTDTINGVSNGDLFICYPDNGYNRIVYEAGVFIDQYMKFETVWLDEAGDGSCKSAGWYSSAKTAFLYAKEDEKADDILAHEPTKYRLSAWAKANGDTFDPITATFSSARITPILSVAGDNNAMTTVVTISILSISAVAGYFFFRKNRNKEE